MIRTSRILFWSSYSYAYARIIFTNVFVYRFNAKMDKTDAFKINQTFGISQAAEELEIPSKYIILNPSDIQLQGSISFSTGVYYKVVTDYELQRLRHPQTEEDQEVFDSLPEQTQKLITETKDDNLLCLDLKKVYHYRLLG